MVAVLLGVVSAAVLTADRGYVTGGLVLSSVCVVAALLRLALPTSWVGTLAVRTASLDALVLLGLAGVVTALTLSVPPA